jgi:hypothetical protein
MAKQQWCPIRPKQLKLKLPGRLKAEVQARANQLVETVLKPAHIKPPEENERFNYVVDIFTKWHRSYFYFCAKYCSPGPNAITPFFETRFARLAYIGSNRFGLSYMRHTGQWWEIYPDLSLEECLSSVRDKPHFQP